MRHLRSLIVLAAFQAFLTQHAFADGGDLAGKTAVQAYKNIQVLKELPAAQLLPTMFFMRSSLGVSCDHCHVDFELFESDANRTKQKAREMTERPAGARTTTASTTCRRARSSS